MTQEQLNALIQYINAKVAYTAAAPRDYARKDRAIEVMTRSMKELEDSVNQGGES